MASDSFQSPNAIPPRTTSAGLSNMNGPVNQSKPVLRPLSEGNWISVQKKTGPDEETRARGNSLTWEGNQTWSHRKENIVRGPYNYISTQPGKDVRNQMIQAFNAWLKLPEDRLEPITKVIFMLHNASLLIDDVEDSSLLRRGSPVAHSVFGIPQTINSGNYIYFLALQELIRLDNPALVQIYCDELCNLHRGQGIDLYWRDTLTCPTEKEYLDMVSNKTGGLFRLAIKLMQAESKSQMDCVPLVDVMGLVFQIRDDYMNLFSTEYTQNKGLCEDLTEGKFSFPVIHSIHADTNNLELLNILKQKTSDRAVKEYAVNYMKKTGSFEYCQEVVRGLLEQAETMLHSLDKEAGYNPGVRAILKRFAIEEVQQK